MSNEGVAGFIAAIGWLTAILGAIAALLLFLSPAASGLIAAITLAGGISAGITMVGFGRIILLLTQIQAGLHIQRNTIHQPSTLPSVNLWEKSQTASAEAPQTAKPTPRKENHWFIHCGRRVEVSADGRAMVDGMKFSDTDTAKAFLNEQYPGRA
ncbi:hypothetical protein IP70_15645 [alpha proteobacterium AAP38]|nr:hypothetical protein IP70_15645 [alpha proteobacterium AAP38]